MPVLDTVAECLVDRGVQEDAALPPLALHEEKTVVPDGLHGPGVERT
jgi:hypothetical protein